MLPNSRIIPPNNNNNTNNNTNKNRTSRRRSNSMFNDNSLKKGFMSRFLNNSTPVPAKEYNQPIYHTSHTNSISTSFIDNKNNRNSTGFSKLFKKKEKITIEEDNQPIIRPISQQQQKDNRKSKIPLAPPPQNISHTASQPDLQQILNNLPTDYHPKVISIKERPDSVRKSTGSYSIYSTFGGNGSDISIDETDHTIVEKEESTDTDSDDDDDFVDATGISQEDMERLVAADKLSKRLSGGHFGSAGGLLQSIQTTDDELAKSMLNWKRQSNDYKRWSKHSFLEAKKEPEPPVELPSPPPEETKLSSLSSEFSKTLDDVWKPNLLLEDTMTQKLKESIHDTDKKVDKLMDDKIKETAMGLWNDDETVISKEKMAEWLGQAKPFQNSVLEEYMKLFVFSDMRLDNAFRKLCSKLYFKAEAQQIDRILECFANRYWECNPECLFGSSDIVYAVVYSLLLLNTDLHVAQGNHARMTRSEFIRNTMSTIQEQREHEVLIGYQNKSVSNHRNWEADIEHYLKEMYISVKHYQILQPLNGSNNNKNLTKRRSSLLLGGGRRVVGLKRSVGSIIRKSGRESMLLADEQNMMTPTPRLSMSSGYSRPMTPSSSIKSPRRESFSSTTSSISLNSGIHQPWISDPPYYKEGVVIRKHLLENATQKARHREWKECLLEVGVDGELRMYATNSTMNAEGYQGRQLSDSQKPSKSQKNKSQFIGKISLNHTLSNPLPPPGYNRNRPFVFALQQSDGGVYLFQVTSLEQAQEWVSTCNYWAARGSKEPLSGAIGNIEYGWGSCLDGVDERRQSSNLDPDSIVIQDWIPPQPSITNNFELDEKVQYQILQNHLKKLNQEINQHQDIKTKMLVQFPSKCNNHLKVMNNWEARSKYLLHDIIKYQHYCDAIENSLKERKMEESHINEEEEQAEEKIGSKLEYQSSSVNLFEEINQELALF